MIETFPTDAGSWYPTLALEGRARMGHPAFGLMSNKTPAKAERVLDYDQ
jgi:hypothetical protein